MTSDRQANSSNMLLSHIELYVQDLVKMEAFYTNILGFFVTDRGAGESGMVFLSRSPKEHHQIVLNPRETYRSVESPIDHIAFRVNAIADLRLFNSALMRATDINLQTVSHGNAWSIYFRDPEGNRFEIFTDTPWYVNQPCKFAVDFTQSDEALIAFTREKVEKLPGFAVSQEWQKAHEHNLAALEQ
jgi:catechol-2,3-dioxygenase